jgi:putative adenylate-forming enzyme
MSGGLWTLARILHERQRQERSCRWSRERLIAHQRFQLDRLRRFALEQSPFYAEFHRGLRDAPLEALPILTKALLMEHFDRVVTDRRIRLSQIEEHLRARAAGSPERYLHRYVALATSGSTGQRGIFLFDRSEWIRAVAAIARPIAWAGAPRRPLRPPRAALIAARDSWHYSARVGEALASRLAPALRLDAATPIAELVGQLNAWRPEALATYPSVLRHLAAEQLAGRLSIPLANVATSAEPLTSEVRASVRSAWGIRVQDTYGATEYAPIASECPQGRMHLFENGAIIELVDAAGRPVADGERGARILLTVFARHTQPLIRYELSDRVQGSRESCPCGRPYRVITAVEGREEDILVFAGPDGRPFSVHPNQFHDALERTVAEPWQIEQRATGLLVRLVSTDASSAAEVERALGALFAGLGVAVPVIEVERVRTLARGASGKAPLIIARHAA